MVQTNFPFQPSYFEPYRPREPAYALLPEGEIPLARNRRPGPTPIPPATSKGKERETDLVQPLSAIETPFERGQLGRWRQQFVPPIPQGQLPAERQPPKVYSDPPNALLPYALMPKPPAPNPAPVPHVGGECYGDETVWGDSRYHIDMQTHQWKAPNGRMFWTLAPASGWAKRNFEDPDALIHGLDPQVIEYVWNLAPKEVVMITIAGEPAPTEDQVASMISIMKDGLSDITGLAPDTFKIVAPYLVDETLLTPPPNADGALRFRMPTTWFLIGMPEYWINVLTRTCVWSSSLITMFIEPRRLRLPRILFAIDIVGDTDEKTLTVTIRNAFMQSPVRDITAEYIVRAAGRNRTNPDDEFRKLLGSIETEVVKLKLKEGTKVIANVFCDPPMASSTEWREWRERLRNVSWKLGYLRPVRPNKTVLCRLCRGAYHTTAQCGYTDIHGWNGPRDLAAKPPAMIRYGRQYGRQGGEQEASTSTMRGGQQGRRRGAQN